MLHCVALSNFKRFNSLSLELGNHPWQYLVVVVKNLILNKTLSLIKISNVNVFVGFKLLTIEAATPDLKLIKTLIYNFEKLMSIVNTTLIQKRLR